jgi:hypothetical protein
MSKKDGKAVLLNAAKNKDLYILDVNDATIRTYQFLEKACPVKIIKLR